ncbi:MAG: hypothetical protein ACI3XM_11335 [Eubacteriales bacterium]
MLVRVVFEYGILFLSAAAVYVGYCLICRFMFGSRHNHLAEHADADSAEYVWRQNKQQNGLPSVTADDADAERILEILDDR